MNVLVNALQAANRSGTGVYTTQLARWLPHVAGEVGVRIVWPKDCPLPEDARREAFVFMSAPRAPRRIWLDQVGMRGLARSYNADVVHYPASVGPVFSYRRIVITVHDLSFLHDPDWFGWGHAVYFRWLAVHSIRRAKRLIAVSQTTANDLVERLDIPESRIDVVHNGIAPPVPDVPVEAAPAVRARYNLPDAYFLYMGTIEPRKNLERLIRAYDSIAGQYPYDLVLAGREGWKTEPIHETASKVLHHERIHFPGFIAEGDKHAVITGATAFVYPSLHEGFGLPVGEAMALGVPVITASTTSLPELANDAAILVDPMDESKIRDALRQVVDDERLRAALVQRGPVQAARFTWRSCAEHTLAAYRCAAGMD